MQVKKPRVFIGSSRKHIKLAEAVQANLARTREIESIVWDQGIFRLSVDGLTSLLSSLDRSDFGIFVLAEDDEAVIKGKPVAVTRDNVIFEFGMYLGRLGPGRAFAITPPITEAVHLPSDLDGIMFASLQDVSDGNPHARVGPACTLIKDQIQELGRKRGESNVTETAASEQSRADRYREILERTPPEIYIEQLIRTDELLPNGDSIIKEKFSGVRAYGAVPISEVRGAVQSLTGRPSAPEVVSETAGHFVNFAWEDINSSGPIYPVKTIFDPPLNQDDRLSFRRERLFQNCIFWNQRDRMEATGHRANKENISQHTRQAFDRLDMRVIFPPKHFPTTISVSVKNPQGDVDREETAVALRSFASVQESRTALLRIDKPLLNYLYVIEWDLPEEDTSIPYLEPRYSGFVEELNRRFIGIRAFGHRLLDVQEQLRMLRKSMESHSSESGIDKSELSLFLYDRARGGLVCVATTDNEIDSGAVERYLFRPGLGIPGRVYRTMENVVYANLPNLKRQVEMYEAVPPGTPKPQNIVLGFPIFHHSSKSRCIAVVTLSSHPQTESLLPLADNPDLCRDLRVSAEAWYQSLLTKYGNVSSIAFWE